MTEGIRRRLLEGGVEPVVHGVRKLIYASTGGAIYGEGLEAIFNSQNRNEFRGSLSKCLGESAHIFADWNSAAGLSPPSYTVDDNAIPLYMLRSKIAHGAVDSNPERFAYRS